jgi:HEAT repeat protein
VPYLCLRVLALCVMVSLAQHQGDEADLISALANPLTTVDAAARLITLGMSSAKTRQQVGRELPTMLLQTKSVPVVQNEAKVAGALKLESTIPSLIQLLSQFNEDGNSTITAAYELRIDPVARALYEIGTPAEPALIRALESKDIKTRQRVVGILKLTNTSESWAILQSHLAKEPDPHLKEYIQGILILNTK